MQTSHPTKITLDPILELKNIQCGSHGVKAVRLEQFSASVRSGDLVQITLGKRQESREFVSLLLGLSFPIEGSIRFMGNDWLGTQYTRHFAMRSRIGRVFTGTAWMQSLTVGENIQLPQLHHRVPKATIRENIEKWTTRLSRDHLGEVREAFNKRPAYVDESILQMCQWIRAFAHQPRLVILERPLLSIADEGFPELFEAIRDLQSSGTAIVWFSSGDEDKMFRFETPIRQWSVQEGVLASEEEQRVA